MTLYLIAHKVRGEPAFDVATCEEVEGETHWIIPTSGHRAYPFHWTELPEDFVCTVPEMPLDLPDHYTVRATPARKASEPPEFIKQMLRQRQPTVTINRRGL